jgi:hypothetical protein
MASIDDAGRARTALAAAMSGLTGAAGAGWTTSTPSWVVSWAEWGRDKATTDAPAPRFTSLVAVKDGARARR